MDLKPGDTDEETAMRGIEAMEDFYRQIGMPISLRELGVEVREEQILQMAESCMKGAGGKKGSAKVLLKEDIAEIYRMAR